MVCKAAAHCEAAKHGKKAGFDACAICEPRNKPCKCTRCGWEINAIPGSLCLVCGLPGGMVEQPPQASDLDQTEKKYLRVHWGSKL